MLGTPIAVLPWLVIRFAMAVPFSFMSLPSAAAGCSHVKIYGDWGRDARILRPVRALGLRRAALFVQPSRLHHLPVLLSFQVVFQLALVGE
jgi:hypothetical protein